jgi:hypothetical protein
VTADTPQMTTIDVVIVVTLVAAAVVLFRDPRP